MITCSIAYDWAIRQLYGMDKIDYGQIEQELKKEQEPAGCLVLPYFKGSGAPDWNSQAKAIFADVTLATRRSEMLKAVLEGIFMEMNNRIKCISSYVPVNKIFVSGGMTNSDVICQLQSDIYGRELMVRNDAEATAFGVFLVCMVSLGKYVSMEEAQQALNPMNSVRVFTPDPEKYEKYQAKQTRMNQLYQVTECLNGSEEILK